MVYEFKVSGMAEEFGVHRNTIRNWINSGVLPAKQGPGRKYFIAIEEYEKLCEKFGRKPTVSSAAPASTFLQPIKAIQPDQPLLLLGEMKKTLYHDPYLADMCSGCGACASVCALSGVDGLDPRKIVRMAFLGLEEELIASDWIWKCTLCGKCEYVCPANIELVPLIRRVRARRERNLIPASIHEGVLTCLERGNNLGISKDDFSALLEELGEDMQTEGCRGFFPPIDVPGARVLVQQDSKDLFLEPDNMKWWWKIFHAAGESWTLSSENWEGSNWGYYSGDDKAMKTMVGRIIDNMRRLNCEVLLLPEAGHAYFATRYCLQRWYPDALDEFRIQSVFDLLLDYIKSKKIILDRSRFLEKVVYHDPCNYGRKSRRAFGQHYFDEAREILAACCENVDELEPNREAGDCCGAGGGAWLTPYQVERVFFGKIKAQQILGSGAGIVVTSCSGCRDQLDKSLVKEFNLPVKIKFLWELVADSLILPEEKEAAHENR